MSPGALCPACGVAALVEADDGGMECSDESCGARQAPPEERRQTVIGRLIEQMHDDIARGREKHDPTYPKKKRASHGSV